MKTLKEFLNEAANAIKSLGATRELFKKSKLNKLNGSDKKKYDKYNNPEKPSEIDLIRGTTPVKKA